MEFIFLVAAAARSFAGDFFGVLHSSLATALVTFDALFARDIFASVFELVGLVAP